MTDGSGNAGNLRLPVPFFDLLMTLLICFLIFVAPVQDAATRNIDIPVARVGEQLNKKPLLAVLPHRNPEGWAFEVAVDGRRLLAEALAAVAIAENRKVVIVAPATTPLQDFVEIQALLRNQKIDFGLAVRSTQEVKS